MAKLHVPSKRLILSYIFDWLVIIIIAMIGVGFNRVAPYHRPFSPVDLTISFPSQEHEHVPTWLLIFVALIIPVILIFLICAIFVPGPASSKKTSREQFWRMKLWELNTGWMGLLLGLAVAFALTEGLKNLFGKPRPDLLSRCQPDLENFEQYVVGAYGQDVSPEWVLVNSGICRQTERSILNDGFRNFPSGHASSSWAGMLYLTLYICSKFAIAVPFLSPRPYSLNRKDIALEERVSDRLPLYHSHHHESSASSDPKAESPTSAEHIVTIRNQAAAPPNYLLILALIPVCAAAYISSSRYVDFRHKGVDILSGSLIGIASAYFSFRWYHLPIRQGGGWAWGARSRDRAFGIGIGVGSYVGAEGWAPKSSAQTDAEPSLRTARDVEPSSVNGAYPTSHDTDRSR